MFSHIQSRTWPLPGEPNDRVPLGGGSGPPEEGDVLLVLPRVRPGGPGQRRAEQVPAPEPRRVEPDGRAARPERPGRVGHVQVVAGLAEGEQRQGRGVVEAPIRKKIWVSIGKISKF